MAKETTFPRTTPIDARAALFINAHSIPSQCSVPMCVFAPVVLLCTPAVNLLTSFTCQEHVVGLLELTHKFLVSGATVHPSMLLALDDPSKVGQIRTQPDCFFAPSGETWSPYARHVSRI